MNIFTPGLNHSGSNPIKNFNSYPKLRFAFLTIFMMVGMLSQVNAQLTGVKAIPTDYATIAAAVTDLNAVGVGAGGVIFNVAAGHTETLTARINISATGTAANPITFQKSGVGANPKITAFVGANTPTSNERDGMFSLTGSDFVTIDGIDLAESAANLDITTQMEYGYGLFKASDSDGCQNNTIKNCVVTLDRLDNAAGTGVWHNGSCAIVVLNCTPLVNTAIVVSAASGSHSNNKFYTNTVQNCNAGIVFIAYGAPSPFTLGDTNNDVGGTTAMTGNTVLNFGGSAGATNPATGIFANNQWGFNCSRNTINNNNGSGVNHVSTLRGIFLNSSSTSASADCNFNTITIKGSATTSQVSCIENSFGSTALGNTININNNTITNCATPLATTGIFYGIYSTASCANLNINNNTFTNNDRIATSGVTYLIYNSGAVLTQININNNSLSQAFSSATAYTGTFTNIYNTSGTTTTKFAANGNTFSNYSYTATGTGALYYIYNTNNFLRVELKNNTWNNISVNHSGSEYFMYNSTSTQGDTLFVQNNSIVGSYTRTAAAGTMYIYYSGASSIGSNKMIFSNNNFSNITAATAGTGTFYGFYNSDGASSPYPKKFIFDNTFSNINYNSTGTMYVLYTSYLGDGSTTQGTSIYNNTISGITFAGTLYGLYVGGTVSPTYKPNVFNNKVFDLTGNSTTASVYATYLLGGGAGLNFYKNKIYNIVSNNTSTTALNCGVYVSSAIATDFYNNYVGDIKAPTSANPTTAVNGVYVAGGTILNMYYNTIYLSGTSSGANFGGNALYASTTPALTLRNNIFKNQITPVGTGVAVAYRRSSSTLTTYQNASNNNMFYAGTPGAANLIYTDGTTPQQTIGGYKTAVNPRDGASVSENTTFLSLTGSSANYLHIDPTIATQLESNAVNIAGITDDYDADVRQGNPGYGGSGSAPDIGADEGNFIPLDISGPGIIYTALGGSCGTGDLFLNGVVISDVTGIPLSGSFIPRIYYKKGAGSYVSSAGTFVSGTTNNSIWNFTMSAALLGGLATGDVVSYYVIAQDNIVPTNVSSNPGGVVATDVLTITTDPATPNTATILASLSGTYTVGAGGNYTTLSAAISAYNTSCVNGPVVFSLIDEDYNAGSGELFPITINQIVGQSAVNTLTIKPASGVTPTISGSSTTCMIRLNGADYVTIDGSNTVGGTSRDLTVNNSSVGTNTAVLCVQSLGTSLGATNDVLKNMIIIGGSNTVTSTFGIHVAGTTVSTSATGDDNDNLTVQNNDISAVYYGIYARASSVAGSLDGLSIIQNSLGSTTNSIGFKGMDFAYLNGPVISQNAIFNIKVTGSVNIAGMDFGAGVQNASITRNNIYSLYSESPSGYGAYGINFSTSTSVTNNLIANNFISDIKTANYSSSTTWSAFGIRLVGGTNFTVANNSVHFFGNVTAGTGTSSISAPFCATVTSVTGTILKNNIFFNEQNFSVATGSVYSVYVPSGYVFAEINNNDYFGSSTATTNYYVGYYGSNKPTLADWKLSSGQDGMSINLNPLFTSNTDLHIVSNECLNQGGMPVAGVTVDYDGMARDAVRPDIGADEFTGTDVTFAFTESSGTNVNDGTICAGDPVVLTVTGGASYLWSPTNETTPSITVNPVSPTTYSVTVTLAGGCTRVFSQAINVNALPFTDITPDNPGICAGQSITLNASGTGTFAWSTPPGGSGSSIMVTPASTSTYSVTLTDANACAGTASETVNVNPQPTVAITPADITICDGQPTTLVATGTDINSYLWSTTETSASIVVSPSSTTTYSVTVTGSPGSCTATDSRTVNVNPVTNIASSVVLPSTCFTNDGSITLTLTGAPGPYSFNWTTSGGGGLINGNQNQTGLSAGIYFVTVTAGNGCTSTSTISLDLNPSCSNCPLIGSLSSNATVECKNFNFTLTAGGLIGMGSTYGITFIYSSAALADPYSGGTVLGTVANGSLTGGGTTATLTANIPNSGTYFIYAILSPTPGDPTCRPSKSANITIVSCDVTISDPCSCRNNATTLTNGQFDETITVTAPSGQTWTISSVTGLYQPSSTPGSLINFPASFPLTEVPLGGGVSDYELVGVHVDALGYSITVANGLGSTASMSNFCYYPDPSISGLASTYCANDPNVTLMGSAVLGGPPGGPATGVGTFTVNGTPNTIFSPASLGAGTHTVVYSFDAADNNPNISHPGCIQPVPPVSVLVNPVPTINTVANAAYCPGATVPASNFTGNPPAPTTVYNWTRTAGAIGLAPLSGTGNVPSFIATNAGITPVSSTFTVTPSVTAGGKSCPGTPITYTITVNPTPSVNAQTNKTYCSGVATGGITFTGTATSYNWTNTNTLIGLAASGTASPTIPSWIPVNLGALPIVGTITVTPVYTNGGVTCTGTPITFTITVGPAPKAVCKNFTLNLDAAGNATLTPANVDGGSTGGTLSLSKTTFDCGSIGANNVTLTVTDACGGTSSCVAVVTVADNIPPTLVCPGNINVILDPGECDKGIFFQDPYATDNCEIAFTTGFLTSTFNSNNQFAGNMFNLTNNTANPITINSFAGNVSSAAGTPVSFQIFYTTTANTYVGNTNVAAAWTLLGSANSVSAGINQPTPVPIGGLTLQPGETKGIYFVLSNYGAGGSLRYTNNNANYTNGELTINAGIGKANPNFTGTNFLARSWNGTIYYTKVIGAPPVVVQTDNTGYKNGDLFPLGTTCLTYKATDYAGNTSTCEVCVNIEEYPSPKSDLSCNNQIQVSLDGDCEAIIGADDLLEGGPYKCYNNYLVEIFKNNKLIAGSPKVTGGNIGDVLTGKVTDPATGNSCWSQITVEDKLPPVLNCVDNVVNCEDATTPGNLVSVNQSFSSGQVPIADNAVSNVNITVAGAPIPANVQNLDLNVFIDIDHTWIGDIDAVLVSPSGTTITLFDRPGVPASGLGCANDNILVTFDDQAVNTAAQFENSCGAGANAIEGTYQPVNLLANMTNAMDLNGNWTLIVRDYVGGDAGAVIKVSLQFSYQNTLYNPDPTTLDNCDNFVDVSHSDVVAAQPCSSPYTSIITRNWVAEDNYGNKSQCSQNIYVLKKQLSDLKYPANYDDLDQPSLPCTSAYPTPLETGSVPSTCSNINCTFEDEVFDVCQNSYKIIRTWTCLDWCNGVIDQHQQIIKVIDKVAPVVTCPKPADVTIDYYNAGSQYQGCEAHVSLPWAPISDNCSTFNNINVQVVTTDAKGVLYSATDPGADNAFEFDLVPGNYIFTYEATDDCGNLGTCTVAVQIKDNEEPVAVCESYHQVSLTDSVTVVNAEAFDDGSYDKCGPVTFLARRLDNPKCQGNDATPFGPTVPFYCCDAKGGQDVTVELRAVDQDGNFNTCWSVVKVEDKVRPLIVCPADITVWCGAPYTPSNIDTTIVHHDINASISEVYAHKYQFPIDVEGFPKGSTINDLDVSLDIDHDYTNQLEVALFDPFGNKATLFTTNSCPGSYGINIDATFNDEAFDIAYWNSTYNSQYKSGVKIPANFTCISSKIPSIGTYNTGSVTGTNDNYLIGQMRPQADHLKVFDGYPLNNINSKAYANVLASDIDVNSNRISNFELYNLIDGLGLAPGQRLTLRYDAATGGTINALDLNSYYIFQIVDPFTIELIAENGTDIISVPAGSTHKFTWSSTWVLQVYDSAPLAGGKVNSVDLHFAWGLPTALKPVVTDNTEACGLMVTWSDLDQPDPCYNNVIRRRWVATDMFTNSRNCIQRIAFEDETPLVVQFPCDVTIQCDDSAFNIDEYVAANKPLHSGDCESVGVESVVHELTVVPDACRKYIIHWKVIDWCEYDINSTTNTAGGISLSYDDVQEWFPNLPWHNQCDYFIPGFPFNILAFEDDGDGYFEHTQYIKVLDKNKPLLPCKDTVICSYAACNETVTLNAKATDLCTADANIQYSYKVDAFNDGTIEVSSPYKVNSPSFTGNVPFGKHRITWTATDGCGNYSTCSYIFYVKDCKKPTPVCINGLSAPTMPVQKVVTIWATDWESGSSYDNCCAFSDLVHRVVKTLDSDHQTPPTATSVSFDCTELGSQPVELWVGDCGYDENGDGQITDNERNWDYCNTFVLVSDNDGVCGSNPMAIISGTVKTELGVGVSGVDLTLLGSSQSVQTSISGNYSFTVPVAANYSVVPSKNINFLNGVNTLDLVYITNHILGKKALDGGYKKIAADINKDKKITTGDLVQLRQLILHITNEFPSNTSWRFVDEAYTFTTSNQMGENFPEVATENNLNGNQINNFIGVKIGDVTNSVNPNAITGGSNESRSSTTLNFVTEDQDLVAGTEYKVNITTKDFRNITGYQFTMSYDVDMLDFVSVDGKALDIVGENFGLTNLTSGRITTSWNGKALTTISENEVLFTLTFKALKSGKLSKGIQINSSLTEAIAFNKDEEALNVNLEFNKGGAVVSNFELLQNQPNPFKEYTVISFILPQATKATLKIYDVAGKVLKVVEGDYSKGMNNVKIERSEIPATGVLYYQLDTDTDSAVKKMIIVE